VRLNTIARRIVGVLAVGALVTGVYVAATEVIEIYACGFEKLTIPGVPNAGRINAHLYRGGQPTADGLAALRSLGIDTIVSFTLPTEADEAHALGLQYVHLPWSASALPPVEYLARFLRMTAQGQSRVVFVHCKAGADRTGLMIAAYRVPSNGWTPDDALYEMNAFGYEVEFHPQLRRFVRGLTPAHTPGDVVAMAPVVQAPDTAKRRASVMP
jgi:protein tyrosine phosphatase (PTP) superfamily phosphohydrolase (DUF442 family)